MNLKESWNREMHLVKYGQTWRFRAVKYAILIPLFGAAYHFLGLKTTAAMLLVLVMASIALHAFLSWKTERWSKSWGVYKRIKLENEI